MTQTTMLISCGDGGESSGRNVASRWPSLLHHTIGLGVQRIEKPRLNASINSVRQFYENFVPSCTIYDIDCPDNSFRKFTDDGKYLISFSRSHQELIVYRPTWLSFSFKGEDCNSALPQKAKRFESFFIQLYTVSLAMGNEFICKDFFLYLETSEFGLFATSTAQNHDVPSTEGTVNGVPCIEKITFHLVRLEDGVVLDVKVFFNDFINLSHSMGVFLHEDLLCIMSMRYQAIHIMQIRDSGNFVDVRMIGKFCREDDELFLSSHTQLVFCRALLLALSPTSAELFCSLPSSSACYLPIASKEYHAHVLSSSSAELFCRACVLPSSSAHSMPGFRRASCAKLIVENSSPCRDLSYRASSCLAELLLTELPAAELLLTEFPIAELLTEFHIFELPVADRKTIDEVCSNENCITPIIFREIHVEKEKSGNLKEVSVLALSYPILSWGVNARVLIHDTKITQVTEAQSFLTGIKQRVLSYIFHKHWSEETDKVLRIQHLKKKFYFHFQDYVDLIMWKVQLLDRSHLLIKFGSVDGGISRTTDQHPSFFAVYNMETTEIISFFQNSTEELYYLFEQFFDHFNTSSRTSLHANFISSHSNNIYALDQLCVIKHKASSFLQFVKKMVTSLPYACQSQSPSPYFDLSLFRYDDKVRSKIDRLVISSGAYKPAPRKEINRLVSNRSWFKLKIKQTYLSNKMLGVSASVADRVQRGLHALEHKIRSTKVGVDDTNNPTAQNLDREEDKTILDQLMKSTETELSSKLLESELS
ncbi:Light-mediated development protein DET1 [Platanthera zijinensis]|uniref:Light-mediated development protein DET1 n=1 Tax=Platanthera zijinensis TaxID=2320716 RepID=A0AAP0G4E7_9ASPA